MSQRPGQAVACLLCVLTVVGCSDFGMRADPESIMTVEEVAREKERLLARERTVYYVGDEYKGERITSVHVTDSDVYVAYGPCMRPIAEGPDGGGCKFTLLIRTQAGARASLNDRGPCAVEKTILGVPAVRSTSLRLLTGGVVVTVEEDDDAASALRPLDHAEPVDELPRPTESLLAEIERQCG